MNVGRTKKQPRAARAGLVFPEATLPQLATTLIGRQNSGPQHPTTTAGRSKKRGQNT